MSINNVSVGIEMPKYKSHKEVWALKIKSIEYDVDLANKENRETDGSAILTFEDKRYTSIKVNQEYVGKINLTDLKDKGYYVVYKDGYKSWSPTKAFEEGYTWN